jgi:kumamolisin
MRIPPKRLVAGSGVSHPLGAVQLGDVEPELPLQVTVVLRPRDARAHVAAPAMMHPADRRIYSTAELGKLYDPGKERVAAVRSFARRHGLSVREVSAARHDVVLDGTAEQFSQAMGVKLRWWEADGIRYHSHDERIGLPQALRRATEDVLGLDTIPTHRSHAMVARPKAHKAPTTPAMLERQYAFPTTDARAHRIALLEFGGGYATDDIAAFAERIGIGSPHVTAVSVPGPSGPVPVNAPLDRSRAAAIAGDWNKSIPVATLFKKYGNDLFAFLYSMEVTMDIELALALGGGAAVDVYFANSGVDGWRRALYSVIGLPVGCSDDGHPPKPTVLSISWGDSEHVFGMAKLRLIERVLITAQRAGVAVCCSSGDWGSLNSAPKPGVPLIPNVNFPASSPSVLACGGTQLLSPSGDTRPEVAWDETVSGERMATGGGMSGYFQRSRAQRDISVRPAKGTWRAPGRNIGAPRALPDVAANAAMSSGPLVRYAGKDLVGYGTSAATPICAALLTRVAASVGHAVVGLEGWLYSTDAKSCLRPITKGENGVLGSAMPFYRAGPGWNACAGLGALHGEELVGALIKSRRPSSGKA